MIRNKLKIYNTLTRKKEIFIPLVDQGKKDFVGIYTCGPTVYYDPHIGNMRAYIFADILRNVIKNILGYPVKHIVNITDVGHLVSDGDTGEDKLEKGSKREGISAWDVAKKYESIFRNDLKNLNIEDFNIFPKATDHIKEQIEIVETLEKKGYTYKIPGDGIYMDTSKIEDYGKLMGANYKTNIQGLNAGERIELGGKKHHTDFALWKFSPQNEKRQMERDSPRGAGFPGWHIECTAMSCKYLGQEFDIHTGGFDHIPIHHTNEIAQAECAFGIKDNIKYWMHIQFLNIDGGKISKSSGSFITVSDIIKQGINPIALRYMFLHAHYRNFQDFTWENLKSFENSYKNLINQLTNYFDIKGGIGKLLDNYDFKGIKDYEEFKNKYLKSQEAVKIFDEILEAIFDDLNTTQAISTINKYFNLNSDIAEEIVYIILYLDEKLFKLDLKNKISNKGNIDEIIIQKAQQRRLLKQNKDFEGADRLRQEIESQGYEIKDNKDGSYFITKL